VRRHRGMALAAALAVATGIPAWAGQAPIAPERSTTGAHAPLTSTAFLHRQIASLRRMGVPRELLTGAARAAGLSDDGGSAVMTGGSSEEPPAYLDFAGPMSGREQVVLETRYPYAHGRPELQLTARSARTGKALWTRTERLATTSFEAPLVALTGADARPGLVLLRFDFAKNDSGLDVTMTLTGCSGTGATLWRHRERGRFDASGETTLPAVLGDFAPSGAREFESLLLQRENQTSDSSGNSTFTITLLRLSTRTGTVTGFGAPVSSSAGEPFALTDLDVSGDSYDDAIITVPGKGVMVRSGRDGKAVWTNTSVSTGQGAYAMTVGDVVASPSGHRPTVDVAVTSGPPPPGMLDALPLFLPVTDPTAPAHGTVTLLNGATGSPAWSKSGDDFFVVRTAGPQHVPALGISSSATSYDATGYGTTTEKVTIAAYDVAGNQLFTHDYSVSAKGDGTGFSDGFGDAGAVADWDSDGSLDGLAFAIAFDGNNEADGFFPYHGSDGTPYRVVGSPLYASTSGGGAFVVVTTKHGVTITVHRGRDLKTLFTRRLPHTTGISATNTYGEYPFNSPHAADVLSCGSGSKTAYCADLGPTGRIRWVVHYPPTHGSQGSQGSMHGG